VGHIRKAQASSLGKMKFKIAGENLSGIAKDSEY
jgi:hypothetical protein